MKDEDVAWLTDGRVNKRTWTAVLGLVVVMIVASLIGLTGGEAANGYMNDLQLIGTLTLYTFLPSYLIVGGLITNAQSIAIARAFRRTTGRLRSFRSLLGRARSYSWVVLSAWCSA